MQSASPVLDLAVCSKVGCSQLGAMLSEMHDEETMLSETIEEETRQIQLVPLHSLHSTL